MKDISHDETQGPSSNSINSTISHEENKKLILSYHKEGNWKGIIDILGEDTEGESYFDKLYLWVRPSEENLTFIAQQVWAEGAHRLVSAGCGSGLLEWLIHSVTGLEVDGLEVDRTWWESPYAPPTFLPLQYADEMTDALPCSVNTAIMFCYFNNGPAFHDYITTFQGNCVVVIGPANGQGRHTQPAPFNPEMETLGWQLHASQQIRHTGDYIAIYKCKYHS